MPETFASGDPVARARKLYAERIREEVEPAHFGHFLVVNLDTGSTRWIRTTSPPPRAPEAASPARPVHDAGRTSGGLPPRRGPASTRSNPRRRVSHAQPWVSTPGRGLETARRVSCQLFPPLQTIVGRESVWYR